MRTSWPHGCQKPTPNIGIIGPNSAELIIEPTDDSTVGGRIMFTSSKHKCIVIEPIMYKTE